MPHERFQGQSNMSYRGDAIIQLDWNVGQIMKTLEQLDLIEKTLVVFISDNGFNASVLICISRLSILIIHVLV